MTPVYFRYHTKQKHENFEDDINYVQINEIRSDQATELWISRHSKLCS